MKDEILKDEHKINALKESVQNGREQWQKLFDQNKSLGLIKIKSLEDLSQLAANGETFIRERIANELPAQSFGAFKLKREAAVSLLELPDFTELNEVADECKSAPSTQYYKLSGDTVTINQDELDKAIQSHTLTAKTSGQIALWKAHNEASAALNKLNQLLSEGMDRQLTLDKSLFRVDQGKVIPNTFFYQRNGKFNALN